MNVPAFGIGSPAERFPLGLLATMCSFPMQSDTTTPTFEQNPEILSNPSVQHICSDLFELTRMLSARLYDIQLTQIQMAERQIEGQKIYRRAINAVIDENQRILQEMAECKAQAQAREDALIERIKKLEALLT